MSSISRAANLLGELAELGMGLCRRLGGVAASDLDTPALCQVTDAFCDAGRGVRQSIALRMRIESGVFTAPPRLAGAVGSDALETREVERDERPDLPETDPLERTDWNEYERPDYETPLRLVGDEALDAEAVQAAVETAVARVRRHYAKAEAVLAPQARSGGRAALFAGAAPLRVVDSS